MRYVCPACRMAHPTEPERVEPAWIVGDLGEYHAAMPLGLTDRRPTEIDYAYKMQCGAIVPAGSIEEVGDPQGRIVEQIAETP